MQNNTNNKQEQNREHVALQAYLKLLASKGAPKERLRQREVIILKLIPYIESLKTDAFSFREAVDDFFLMQDEAEWAIYIPVIRDYFSFWINDIKAIAAMITDKAFEEDSKTWKPNQTNLNQLWSTLDEAILSPAELKPLQSYEEALRNRGADDLFVNTRTKLAKLMLLRLREVPHKQPSVYRQVMDSNLSLFTMEETHHTFLKVGREFYYFWKGDAAAPQQVLRRAEYAEY